MAVHSMSNTSPPCSYRNRTVLLISRSGRYAWCTSIFEDAPDAASSFRSAYACKLVMLVASTPSSTCVTHRPRDG